MANQQNITIDIVEALKNDARIQAQLDKLISSFSDKYRFAPRKINYKDSLYNAILKNVDYSPFYNFLQNVYGDVKSEYIDCILKSITKKLDKLIETVFEKRGNDDLSEKLFFDPHYILYFFDRSILHDFLVTIPRSWLMRPFSEQVYFEITEFNPDFYVKDIEEAYRYINLSFFKSFSIVYARNVKGCLSACIDQISDKIINEPLLQQVILKDQRIRLLPQNILHLIVDNYFLTALASNPKLFFESKKDFFNFLTRITFKDIELYIASHAWLDYVIKNLYTLDPFTEYDPLLTEKINNAVNRIKEDTLYRFYYPILITFFPSLDDDHYKAFLYLLSFAFQVTRNYSDDTHNPYSFNIKQVNYFIKENRDPSFEADSFESHSNLHNVALLWSDFLYEKIGSYSPLLLPFVKLYFPRFSNIDINDKNDCRKVIKHFPLFACISRRNLSYLFLAHLLGEIRDILFFPNKIDSLISYRNNTFVEEVFQNYPIIFKYTRENFLILLGEMIYFNITQSFPSFGNRVAKEDFLNTFINLLKSNLFVFNGLSEKEIFEKVFAVLISEKSAASCDFVGCLSDYFLSYVMPLADPRRIQNFSSAVVRHLQSFPKGSIPFPFQKVLSDSFFDDQNFTQCFTTHHIYKMSCIAARYFFNVILRRQTQTVDKQKASYHLSELNNEVLNLLPFAFQSGLSAATLAGKYWKAFYEAGSFDLSHIFIDKIKSPKEFCDLFPLYGFLPLETQAALIGFYALANNVDDETFSEYFKQYDSFEKLLDDYYLLRAVLSIPGKEVSFNQVSQAIRQEFKLRNSFRKNLILDHYEKLRPFIIAYLKYIANGRLVPGYTLPEGFYFVDESIFSYLIEFEYRFNACILGVLKRLSLLPQVKNYKDLFGEEILMALIISDNKDLIGLCVDDPSRPTVAYCPSEAWCTDKANCRNDALFSIFSEKKPIQVNPADPYGTIFGFPKFRKRATQRRKLPHGVK